MKRTLIIIGLCTIGAGQAWSAGMAASVASGRTDAENRPLRSASTGSIPTGKGFEELGRLSARGGGASLIDLAAVSVKGGHGGPVGAASTVGEEAAAASVGGRTTGTDMTAATVMQQTLNGRLAEALKLNGKLAAYKKATAPRIKTLESIGATLRVSTEEEILPRVAGLQEELAASKEKLAQVMMVLGLKAGDSDPVEAVRTLHGTVGRLMGILEVRPEEGVAGVLAKVEGMRRIAMEKEALEAKIAATTAERDRVAAEVESLRRAVAEAAGHGADMEALRARVLLLEDGVRRAYKKMLGARRDAAVAQHAMVETEAARQHWVIEAKRAKGMFAKLEEFDPRKLGPVLSIKYGADLTALLSQIESVQALRSRADGEAIDAILAGMKDPGLSSPLKPAARARATGAAGGRAVGARSASISSMASDASTGGAAAMAGIMSAASGGKGGAGGEAV